MRRSPAFLLLLACAAAPAAASEPAKSFVANGRIVDALAEQGAWEHRDGFLAGTGRGASLALGGIVGPGDFHLYAVLRADSLEPNPGFVRIDEMGEIGFTRPGRGAGGMFVRGFFFGDLTQDASPRSGAITPGRPFSFEIARQDGLVRFLVDGEPFRDHPHEGDRPLGKITFANQHGSLEIAEAHLLSGTTLPLEDWVHPREIEHDLPGEQVDIFQRGEGPYHTYRIPAIERTGTGMLLAFCEGRRNSAADHGDIDILLRRSADGGRTWGPVAVVHGEPGDVTIGNPVPVHDRITGRTWLAFTRNNNDALVAWSDDDGATWSPPRDITASVKRPEWTGWYATGPCSGIQLRSGRLLIPANRGNSSHAFFSDDHGQTWTVGSGAGHGTNEVTMAERSDGAVYLNARTGRGVFQRAIAWSHDGGATFTPFELDPQLPEPTCQGSVIASDLEDGRRVFLFSNPASSRRERLTIRLSEDEGATWGPSRVLYEGSALYSDLVDLGGGVYGCLYERDWYDRITFARFDMDWLLGVAGD